MNEIDRLRATAHYRNYLIAHHNYLDNPSEGTQAQWHAAHEKWIAVQRSTRMTSGERREIRETVQKELREATD